MEEIKINKNSLLEAYRAGNTDQKEMLEHLYGKESLTYNWLEITSYEKACEVLGIDPIEIKEVGNRPQYIRMANAMQQLLVICEAINAGGSWYSKNDREYYPVFMLYSKQEMDYLGKAECKRKGIHKLLSVCNSVYAKSAGVRYANTLFCGTVTSAHYGFPVSLNSEEKAEFVGRQFFELCCQCYGLTLQKD